MKFSAKACERGSVLVVAMMAVFMVSALVMSLFTVVQSATAENTARSDRSIALEKSMSGLNRVMAQINGAEIAGDFLQPAADQAGQFMALGESIPEDEPTVIVRSARLAGGADPVPDGLYDVWEIDSFARVPAPPGATAGSDSYRGVRAIVDIPYAGADPNNPTTALPGACVAEGGLSLAGNAFVDGSDHTAATEAADDGIVPSVPSNVDMEYLGSSAGYKSDFYSVSNDGSVQELVFKGNTPTEASGNTVFPADQKVNFAIKVYPGSETPYWHYAFPRTPDDDRAIWSGDDGIYGTADDRNYCRVEQIDDTTYRLFFEDLEGSSADWDFGQPGDLECPTADQVVDVTLVPDTGSGAQADPAESWTRGTGVPAVAYPGPYENLNLPEETEQLVYTDDDMALLSGRDAYTNATMPVDELADMFADTATVTYDVNNANRLDLGSEGEMSVVLLEPKNGKLTISGQQNGSGLLIVKGDLKLAGQFSYSGLIIATGDVSIAGSGNTDRILGALIAGGSVSVAGNGRILYSIEKINAALGAAGLSWEDLAEFLEPTTVGAPVRRAWIDLNDAIVRDTYKYLSQDSTNTQ